MSHSTSTHESMEEKGPYDAQHQILHGLVTDCRMALGQTIGLLNGPVPSALAAARVLPWAGQGSALYLGYLDLAETVRGGLVDVAGVAAMHYDQAHGMLEATS